MPNAQNDWLAAVLLNPLKDYVDFKRDGLNKDNTDIKPIDSYVNLSEIQNHLAFKDDLGRFDRSKFEQFYNSALRTYNIFENNNLTDNFLVEFEKNSADFTAKRTDKFSPDLFFVRKVPNPMSLTTGTQSLFGTSESKLSNRELAQTQKIYDSDSKQWLNVTPNDQGFFGTLFGKPVALATWDTDGEHTLEDGRIVRHSKGELKYNSDFMPFYETLGNRVPADKDMLHVTDVLTTDGSFWNKFDPFDSDSKEKSTGKIVAQTFFKVAPLIFKGTRNPYALVTAAHSLGEAFTGMLKGTDDLITGQGHGTSWKAMNNIDSFLRKFDLSSSDEAQLKMWGLENMANMFSDVVLLLYQQRGVARLTTDIPKWLGMTEKELDHTRNFMLKHGDAYLKKYGKTLAQAIKDDDVANDFKWLYDTKELVAKYKKLESMEKTAANLSKYYMAVTQSLLIYETMDQAGFSDALKMLGVLGGIAGFRLIFETELGDLALKGLGYKQAGKIGGKFFKELAREIRDIFGKVKPGLLVENELTASGKLSTIKSIGDSFKSYWDKTMKVGGDYMGSAIKEGLEEVSEEALQDIVIGGLDLLGSTFKWLGGGKENTYNWTDTDPFSRYIMSAVGGLMGGPIFTGVERLEVGGFRNLFKIHETLLDTGLDIINQVRLGKTEGLISGIDNEAKKHTSGVSHHLSTKISTKATDAGNEYTWDPAIDYSQSQEAVLAETLKAYVRSIDSIINSEGLALVNGDIVDKAFSKDLKVKMLAEASGFTGKIVSDFKELLNRVVENTLAMKSSEDDGEKSRAITEKLTSARKEIDRILNGERTAEYTEKLMFYLSPFINSSFIDANVEMYALSKGEKYSDLSPERLESMNKEFAALRNLNKDNIVNGKDTTFDWDEFGYNAYKILKQLTRRSLQEFSDNKAYQIQTDEHGRTMVDEHGNPIFLLVSTGNFGMTEYVKELHKIFDPSRFQLSDEELDNILNQYRPEGVTDEDLIEKLDEVQLGKKYTPEEKKELVRKFLKTRTVEGLPNPETAILAKLVSNYIEAAEVAGGEQSLLRLGIDTLTSLKNQTLLQDVLNKLTELRDKTGMKFIDGRTNRALTKLISANNLFDFRNTFLEFLNNNYSYDKLSEHIEAVNNSGKLFTIFNLNQTAWIKLSEELEDPNDPNSLKVISFDENGKPIYQAWAIDENGDIVGDEEGPFDPWNVTYDEILESIVDNTDLNLKIKDVNSFIESNHLLKDISSQLLYQDFLDQELPAYETKYLLIKLAEQLQQKVLINPIYNSLDRLAKEVFGESLSKVINDEEDKFGDFPRLSEYVLSDSVKRDKLYKLNGLINMFRNIVNSSVISYEGFDFNETINHYNEKHLHKTRQQTEYENPTISPEIGAVILNDLNIIQEKLQFLLALDAKHNASKFSDSNKALVRLNSMLIKILTGKVDEKFDFLSKVTYEGNPFFKYDVEEKDLRQIDEYLENPNEQSDEARLFTEKLLTNMKEELFKTFNSLPTDAARTNIVQLMMNGKRFDFRGEQSLNGNTNYDTIESTTVFTSLLAYLSNNTVDFRNNFLKVIGDQAPFSSQMFNAEILCAFVKNSLWFNTAISEMRSDYKKYFADSSIEEWESFTDFMMGYGDPGTGKTDFLARMIVNQLKSYKPNAEIWVSGPNQDRTSRLATLTEVKKGFQRVELFNQILNDSGKKKFEAMMKYLDLNSAENANNLGRDNSRGITVEVDGQNVKMAENTRKLDDNFFTKNDFIPDAIPDLLIIDEVTKYSTFEILILNKAGVKTIGLGDRKLLSSVIHGDSHNANGLYFSTPELSASIRSSNIHKKDNELQITTSLRRLLDLQNRDKTVDLLSTFNTLKQSIALTYYEKEFEDGNYLLNGEKLVDSLSISLVEGLIKNLREGEKLVYIYDDLSASTAELRRLLNLHKDKIHLRTLNNPNDLLNDVQGSEYLYAIVDIAFGKVNSADITALRNELIIKNLRQFNTAISRSKDGTIIVKRDNLLFDNFKQADTTILIGITSSSMLEALKSFIENSLNIIKTTTPEASESILIDPKQGKDIVEAKQKEEKIETSEDETWDQPTTSTPTSVASYTFYNHYSVSKEGNKYIPSGLAEDLGEFGEMSLTVFELLSEGLGYLKNFAMLKAILGDLITNAAFRDKTKYFKEFIDKYSSNNPDAFYNALKSGLFKIKLTNYEQPYSKSINSVNMKGWAGMKTLGRLIYLVNFGNKIYDISIGAISKNITEKLVGSRSIDGKEALYFDILNFNRKGNIKTGNTKILDPEMFDINYDNGNITLEQLRLKHPELRISKVLVNGTKITGGRPFVIFNWNLFNRLSNEHKETTNLLERKVLDYDRSHSDNNWNQQSGILYLDKIGLTTDEWMDEARIYFQNEKENKDNRGRFTGYTTACKFVASMIDFLEQNSHLNKFKKIEDYLILAKVGDILLKSRFLEFGKRGENVKHLIDFIENSDTRALIAKYVSDLNKYALTEENFLESSKKISEILKNSNGGDVIKLLNKILREISDGKNVYEGITPEMIESFIDAFNKFNNLLKVTVKELRDANDHRILTTLMSDLLNNGLTVVGSNTFDIIREIYQMWESGVNDIESGIVITQLEFRDFFTAAINAKNPNSKFFKDGIYKEDIKEFTKREDPLGGYYYNDIGEDMFTTTKAILIPHIIFDSSMINMNSVLNSKQSSENSKIESPKEKTSKVSEIKLEESKVLTLPDINLNDLSENIREIHENLLSLLIDGSPLKSGLDSKLKNFVNKIANESNINIICDELNNLISKTSTSIPKRLSKVNGRNVITEKPKVNIENGKLTLEIVSKPLSDFYNFNDELTPIISTVEINEEVLGDYTNLIINYNGELYKLQWSSENERYMQAEKIDIGMTSEKLKNLIDDATKSIYDDFEPFQNALNKLLSDKYRDNPLLFLKDFRELPIETKKFMFNEYINSVLIESNTDFSEQDLIDLRQDLLDSLNSLTNCK